jgi:separase
MISIVDQSDESARVAKHVSTNAGRMEWWQTRHDLDKRLGELLEGIETNWFGAFKVRSVVWRVC